MWGWSVAGRPLICSVHGCSGSDAWFVEACAALDADGVDGAEAEYMETWAEEQIKREKERHERHLKRHLEREKRMLGDMRKK